MDPMANIGPDKAGTNEDTTGGEGKGIFNIQAQMYNFQKIDEIKSFMGIMSGCFSGICGFTGLQGLACFIILDLVVSFSILAKMKFRLADYSTESIFSFLTAYMQRNSLSFMLFWTLFYGLVYLF